MYEETIETIINISKNIDVCKTNSDGRISSAISEVSFLQELKNKILIDFPKWCITISAPRASEDIIINNIRINLKLTDCKSADNSINKFSIYYSITGDTIYPYSSTWNDFICKLKTAKKHNNIKLERNKLTEYHYLVKNKINGDVILKSIFDICKYISNPSNSLQINWKYEFENKDICTLDKEYNSKIKLLIGCIQRSVKQMIERTSKFAEEDIDILFSEISIKETVLE